MNGLWNLDPIYKGFDDPAFEGDLEKLKQKVAEAAAFAATLSDAEPLAGLKQGIALEEELNLLVYKLAGYASLRQSADTRDPRPVPRWAGSWALPAAWLPRKPLSNPGQAASPT